MAITKLPDGRYRLSIRPYGSSGKYIRRIFNTRSAAVRYEKALLSTISSSDDYKLSALCDLWFDYFGNNLKDGEKRLSKLRFIIKGMGDYRLSAFKAKHYLSYRNKRLESGISANTCNHDLAYLKTVFNKLIQLEYISHNPLSFVSKLEIDEALLTFLSSYQIKRLLVACRQSNNESLFPVVYLCLSTGCRWSEAEQLTVSQLVNQSVTFSKTKSRKNRTVPLKLDLYNYLIGRAVLPNGRIFANCVSAFRNALDRSKIKLPPGQCTHVLRHTFASHFVMNGGDILSLQKILGHSDVKVTMIYAHLSPNYLQEAVRFSPL